MPSKTAKKNETSTTLPLTLAELREIIEACRSHGVRRLELGELSLEFDGSAPAPAPYVQKSAAPALPQPHAPHANSQNALAVAAMNQELDSWTQADAPTLFDDGAI